MGTRLLHITPYDVQVRQIGWCSFTVLSGFGSHSRHAWNLTGLSFSAGLLSAFRGSYVPPTDLPSPVTPAPVFTVTGVSYEVCTNELDGHPRGASLSGQDQLGSAPGTPYWSHFEDHDREQCNGHYWAGRIWAGNWSASVIFEQGTKQCGLLCWGCYGSSGTGFTLRSCALEIVGWSYSAVEAAPCEGGRGTVQGPVEDSLLVSTDDAVVLRAWSRPLTYRSPGVLGKVVKVSRWRLSTSWKQCYTVCRDSTIKSTPTPRQVCLFGCVYHHLALPIECPPRGNTHLCVSTAFKMNLMIRLLTIKVLK